MHIVWREGGIGAGFEWIRRYSFYLPLLSVLWCSSVRNNEHIYIYVRTEIDYERGKYVQLRSWFFTVRWFAWAEIDCT